MILLPFTKGQTVAVIGLGKSGHAVVDALEQSDAKVIAWDDKNPPEGTNHPNEWDWSSIDLMVLSPGVPYTHPEPHDAVKLAQQHDVEIVGDIELLYRACPDAWYIAITGTNGKSTTTSLIAHILQESGRKVQVGGNLGEPVMSMEPIGDEGIYVLELSSYQLDLVRTTVFDTAVWLNISPDHLDRHGGMDGYIEAKKHIFDRQLFRKTDHPKGKTLYAIISVDDPYSEAVAHEIKARSHPVLIPFTTQKSEGQVISAHGGIINDPYEDMMIDISHAPSLQGTHNHQNAVAAYAACHAGVLVSQTDIEKAMHSFGGLAHRMQRVAEKGDVIFVNDSKATNADAAEKSLATFDDIYWIVGGVAKEGGIEPLAPYFPKIKHAFLIGEAQDDFANTLQGQVAYSKCNTLDVAVREACEMASSGVVLLAPACASFDQFPNFEMRGDAFVSAVQSYLDGEVKDAV